MGHSKNSTDPRYAGALERKQQIDAERRAAAVARRQQASIAAMHRVGASVIRRGQS